MQVDCVVRCALLSQVFAPMRLPPARVSHDSLAGQRLCSSTDFTSQTRQGADYRPPPPPPPSSFSVRHQLRSYGDESTGVGQLYKTMRSMQTLKSPPSTLLLLFATLHACLLAHAAAATGTCRTCAATWVSCAAPRTA
jgi:hypothetical protein